MENNMCQKELLEQITACNFMKEDLALYLNTHPMDREAISKYNSYVMEGRELKKKYEMNFGMLCENDSPSPYPWQWINNPWPWEAEANFEIDKEGM
ncbi:MAG: spore coat protein CotJB [Solirubrobacterales bacterium]